MIVHKPTEKDLAKQIREKGFETKLQETRKFGQVVIVYPPEGTTLNEARNEILGDYNHFSVSEIPQKTPEKSIAVKINE